MASFQWKRQYSVNIREIDNQHKKLVALLNDLYKAIEEGGGRESLGRILSELVTYTKNHFATEERLMKNYGYPGYLVHKEKHEKMTDKVLEYRRKFDAGEIQTPIEISNFLKDWLGKHILGTDMEYSVFLNDKGVS